MTLKLPPPEKILEAWSAIGSNRVKLLSSANAPSGEAEAESSDYARTYRLSWDGNIYRSTDNASVWQGYPGYPILALLMLRGILPWPEDLAALLAPLDWQRLNRKAHGNYAMAAEAAFMELGIEQKKRAEIKKWLEETYALLPDLDIIVKRFPPRRKSAK